MPRRRFSFSSSSSSSFASRKEALFVLSLLCVVSIFSIFVLAASKIARELQARIEVFWAITFTTSLAILSLLYLTVFVAYYPPLSTHGATIAIHFLLGVAWAIALVTEVVDPNNMLTNRKPDGRGEREISFHSRVGLSAITAFLMLLMALVGALGVLGITGRRRGRRESHAATPDLELEERRPQGSGAATSVPSSPLRSTFMVVLARVGIVKERSTTTTTTMATTEMTMTTMPGV